MQPTVERDPKPARNACRIGFNVWHDRASRLGSTAQSGFGESSTFVPDPCSMSRIWLRIRNPRVKKFQRFCTPRTKTLEISNGQYAPYVLQCVFEKGLEVARFQSV